MNQILDEQTIIDNINLMEIFYRYIKKFYINRLFADAFNFGNYKSVWILKPIRIINNWDETRKQAAQNAKFWLTWIKY